MLIKHVWGETEVLVGDKFAAHGVIWEVLEQTDQITLGARGQAVPSFRCRPSSLPCGALTKYVEADGSVLWTGDGVAAAIYSSTERA